MGKGEASSSLSSPLTHLSIKTHVKYTHDDTLSFFTIWGLDGYARLMEAFLVTDVSV